MENLINFLKGTAIGAANVIPGVSGGTIAFITGIYERLINAIKAFDVVLIKLVLKGKFKEVATHIDLAFLISIALGIILSLLSVGKLLDYLFGIYPVFVWSFFFGLIAWSVVSVGKSISTYNTAVVLFFILGATIAISLAFSNPVEENSSFFYLILCGIIAIASMILPGLSGSFILILMGNYKLIMLKAVPSLDIPILIPVGIGAIVGFILLSRIISFLLNSFKNNTISLLTGFILGSLLIIWPWKNEKFLLNSSGIAVLKNNEKIIQGYEWFMPSINIETIIAFLFMILGLAIVYFMEKYASKTE